MENQFVSSENDATPAHLASVVAALEPEQLTASKARHRVARRQLTTTEKLIFWILRIYLVFMGGVVLYQIWTDAR